MFTPLKAVVAAPSMVVLLVSSIAVGQQSAAGDTSVVKATIEAANGRFVEAFKHGDKAHGGQLHR